MERPDWAPENQPAQSAWAEGGGDAFNIRGNQNNYHSFSFKEVLHAVEDERKKVRDQANAEMDRLHAHYRGQLERAVRSLEYKQSEVDARDEVITAQAEDKVNLQGALAHASSLKSFLRTLWRPVLIAVAFLLLTGGGLGAGLAWGHGTPSGGGDHEPSGTQTILVPPSTPSVPAPDPSLQSEALVRKYFAYGHKNDVENMLPLLSENFLQNTGGSRADYERLWRDAFLSVDELVSPGRRPFTQSDDDNAVWVQVAWRRGSKKGQDLSGYKYDLDWWKIIRTPAGYKLDDLDGRNVKCDADDVVRCARADKFRR